MEGFERAERRGEKMEREERERVKAGVSVAKRGGKKRVDGEWAREEGRKMLADVKVRASPSFYLHPVRSLRSLKLVVFVRAVDRGDGQLCPLSSFPTVRTGQGGQDLRCLPVGGGVSSGGGNGERWTI
jgi:hypothetical protein